MSDTTEIEERFELFIDAVMKRRIVPLVGAGVSVPHLPMFDECGPECDVWKISPTDKATDETRNNLAEKLEITY
ncbi:hypothetical protein K8T06_06940 [bacterium]|nr:hypothetical protein [bacterium]